MSTDTTLRHCWVLPLDQPPYPTLLALGRSLGLPGPTILQHHCQIADFIAMSTDTAWMDDDPEIRESVLESVGYLLDDEGVGTATTQLPEDELYVKYVQYGTFLYETVLWLFALRPCQVPVEVTYLGTSSSNRHRTLYLQIASYERKDHAAYLSVPGLGAYDGRPADRPY